MEAQKQRSKRLKLSETDVHSLVRSNKMLKEHLDFLRAKLSKTEAILEMYIRAVEKDEEEKERNNILINQTFSLN